MYHVQGNINLIDAAVAKGVKKFVLVTSIGTGDSKDAPPAQVYDVLKPVLLEKEKAEEHLKVRLPALTPHHNGSPDWPAAHLGKRILYMPRCLSRRPPGMIGWTLWMHDKMSADHANPGGERWEFS